MSEFVARNPRESSFWDERFERGFTPWDKGDVPQALIDYVACKPALQCCLIPGCGDAYELVFLAERGWDVAAIDFSIVAVNRAKTQSGPWAQNIELADFFTYCPKFDLDIIYERAFLCALPPSMRPQIIARWAALLPVDGCLIGFFFIDDDQDANTKGPPFSISSFELENLMADFFVREEDDAVSDSLPVFDGKERWQVWRRR